MAKRVAADTITEITGAATFRQDGKPATAAPTPEELIEKTRDRLHKETLAMQAWLDAADPENERTIEQRKQNLAAAQQNEKLLDELVNNVPHGFHLVPTFYSRIPQEDNDKIREQYSYHVRPRFMKFIADNYADDLRALGIAETGIERMKKGLDPTDDNGNNYNLNVDHIVERAGSGSMGLSVSADPDQPGVPPTYNINHFGNFVLLPIPVHEYKNKLNDLQVASDMPYGKGKWILMMVPERDAKHAGFVAQPQPATSTLKGLEANPPGLNHNQYIVQVLLREIDDLKNAGQIRSVVRDLIVEADQRGSTVAEVADIDARQKKGGLRQKFNDAVAKDAYASDIVNNYVRPAIADVTQNFTKLFRKIARDTSSKEKAADFWEFLHAFRGDEVKYLRKDIEALPVPEAAEFVRTFNQMEQDIRTIADRLDAEGKARRAQRQQQDAANGNSSFPRQSRDNGRKPFKKPFNGGGNNKGPRVNTPGAR